MQTANGRTARAVGIERAGLLQRIIRINPRPSLHDWFARGDLVQTGAHQRLGRERAVSQLVAQNHGAA